jgi:hypothetical protein
MGKMMKRLLSVTALAVVMTGTMASAPLLTLNPSNGVVSGTPGSTVGWGFTLSNDSGFLVPSLIVFCEGAFNAGCTPTFGTFTDFAAQAQFNVVGPTVTETFNNATQQGIGSFTINSNAPTSVSDVGTIFLVYDTFSCNILDDNCNPTQTAFSQLLSAPASVNIVGTAAAVPEPGTACFAAVGLALLVVGLRKAVVQERRPGC